MKYRKYSLVIIVLLLIVFVPLTVLGYINKDKYKKEENPNHKLFFEGKLWFYDKNNNLINNYECQTEICDLAKSVIDDEDYKIDYYKDGENNTTKINSNKYVFIQDGELINLYDLKSGNTIHSYLKIKNYNTEIRDNIYILENTDNLWGALSISENITQFTPFEYNFIGLKNDISEEGILEVNNIIVMKDDKWFLLDTNGNVKTTEYSNPIVNYTSKYIITYNNQYKIYNYQSTEYLSNIKIDKYLFVDKYIAVISGSNVYIYIDLDSSYVKHVTLNNNGSLSLKVLDNILYIYENNELLDTYQ